MKLCSAWTALAWISATLVVAAAAVAVADPAVAPAEPMGGEAEVQVAVRATTLSSTTLSATTLSSAGETESANDGVPFEAERVEWDSYDFAGTVSLDAKPCSGSLVRFDDSEETDGAMILSAGHCEALIPSGRAAGGPRDVAFQLLRSDGRVAGEVRAKELLYATMTGADLALFLLESSYAEIRDEHGVAPLTLARSGPAHGDEVRVLAGFTKGGFTCRVDARVHGVREDQWTWRDTIRFGPECRQSFTTSGAPVIDVASGRVVGVANTHAERGYSPCALNGPCEVDAAGDVSFRPGARYGQSIHWLYACRDTSGRVNPDATACGLPALSQGG